MDMTGWDVVTLREVADILGQFGQLRCVPLVEHDDGAVTVTLSLPTERPEDCGDALLEKLDLYHELRYLVDLAQLRALASQFDIEPAQLERLLPKTGDRS